MIQETSSQYSMGYLRPGFYPLKTRTIVPAIVWLNDTTYSYEPEVDYILVKPSFYSPEWEDSLFVAEQDFVAAEKFCEALPQSAEKIAQLIVQLTAKGYLSLKELKGDVQLKELH